MRCQFLRWPFGLLVLLAIVGLVYSPVHKAGFVWDDYNVFVNRNWLYSGDEWMTYLFSGFNDWQYYFRPLVVGLLVLQARLFDGAPEPMHLVTLGMQLLNVGLVVLAARHVALKNNVQSVALPLFAGAFFGLHPMLVETVVWIGCQFDQVQVIFALLGILASLKILRIWPRAVVVSVCFFLSACSKESAALFPLIILVFDWLLRTDVQAPLRSRASGLLRQNWPVYLAMFLAGLSYLYFRTAAMGALVGDTELAEFMPGIAKLEEISYVFVKYWTVVAGIPYELSPIHPAESYEFGKSLSAMLLRFAGAIAFAAAGLLVLTRKFAYTGAVIITTTAYLFPVLGFFPGHFDGSLYHERYAIGAIAVAAVLLPGVVLEWRPIMAPAPILRKLAPALAVLWLAWAVINVRVTIPLWSSDLSLWRWAAEDHGDNPLVKGNLISSLVELGQVDEAQFHVDDALAKDLDCDICYANGFSAAVMHDDRTRAQVLRDRLSSSKALESNRVVASAYYLYAGYMDLKDGDLGSADENLRKATEVEFNSPLAHMLMAELYVLQDRVDEAEAAAKNAVQTVSPMNKEGAESVTSRILGGERVFSVQAALDPPPDPDLR